MLPKYEFKAVDGVSELIIHAKPCAKGRPRFTSRGHAYTPAKTREQENIIIKILADIGIKPKDAAFSCLIEYMYPRPKYTKEKYKTSRPDIDNCAKLFLDAANDYIWHDDSSVCQLHITKKFSNGENPYMRIVWFELNNIHMPK